MTEYKPENALCKPTKLEEEWNITSSPTNNNVRRNYINNPKKNKQYKIIDMGAYCVMNNITPDMLKIFVEYGKKLTELFVGDKKDKNNKIVVMTEEDFVAYEEYKKFKAFSEARK